MSKEVDENLIEVEKVESKRQWLKKRSTEMERAGNEKVRVEGRDDGLVFR